MTKEKPRVAFGIVTRDDCGRQRAQEVVDLWDLDAPVLTMKGISCVATARCLLGVDMANTMLPSTDCVVLLDDDVRPSEFSLNLLITSCHGAAKAGHPTVYAATYPLRIPPPEAGELPRTDNRVAHDVWKDGVTISGGLGCVAIPAALFRWIHLGDWGHHYSIVPGQAASTCPYRVGPRNGIWMTEDLWFFSVLRELSIPSRLIPRVVKHGDRSAAPGFRQLNDSPIPSHWVLE